MTKFKQVSAAAVVMGMVQAVPALAAQGVGFAPPITHAILGETLRISVPLHLEVGDEADGACASANVYYGDSKLANTQVAVSLQSASSNSHLLTVTTTAPVTEPVVSVELSFGCQAKFTRKFVVFADPSSWNAPVSSRAAPDAAASARPPATATTPSALTSEAPAPVTSAPVAEPARAPVRRAARPPRVRHPAAAGTGAAARPVSRPKAAGVPARAASAPARTTAAPKPQPLVMSQVSRLELEPVTPPSAVQPSLRPGVAPQGVIAADLAARPDGVASGVQLVSVQDKRDSERQRLDEMEKLVGQLRQEMAQMRASGPGLAVGRPTGDIRQDHPVWFYGVSGLAALALSLSAYLFMRLRSQEKDRAWWAAHALTEKL